MCSLLVVLVYLNHGGQHVATHVIVNRDVVAYEVVVTIKLHFLTSNTRTLLNSSSGIVTISKLQGLNLIQVGTLSSDSGIQNLSYKSDEILTGSHEVGLALYSYHSGKAGNFLNQHATI